MKNKTLNILAFFVGVTLCAQSIPTPKSIPEVVLKPIQRQNVDSILKPNYTTTHKVYPKHFDKNFREKYQSDEFNYNLIKPKESLWDKISRKLKDILGQLFSGFEQDGFQYLLKIFLRLLAILALGLVLYFTIRYLLAKNGNWIFSKKNKKINPEERSVTENIHELDFTRLIAANEKNKDYRSAIRYHFLWLLKQLTDKNLIEWDPEKTNGDYLRMLQDQPIQGDFRRLLYIFDYIWYGERIINREAYDKYQQEFQNLRQQL